MSLTKESTVNGIERLKSMRKKLIKDKRKKFQFICTHISHFTIESNHEIQKWIHIHQSIQYHPTRKRELVLRNFNNNSSTCKSSRGSINKNVKWSMYITIENIYIETIDRRRKWILIADFLFFIKFNKDDDDYGDGIAIKRARVRQGEKLGPEEFLLRFIF